MSPLLTGAVLGLTGGLGLMLTVVNLPQLRRPTLSERVLPYVQDVSRPSKLLEVQESRNPLTVLEGLVAPWTHRFGGVLEQVSGGNAALRRRLEAAGSHLGVEQFRAHQLVAGILGLAAGLLLTVLAATRGTGSPLSLVVLVLLVGVFGVIAPDLLLTRRIKRRQSSILLEFPTVAELLALSVGAGEGVMAAVDRVARTTNGALAGEFRRAAAEVNAGSTVAEALTGLARRVDLLLVTRFVDSMLVSLGNGTPLAEVLRAQAADARTASRRTVMEDGGKREIAMMVPVVFLVLPITIVFAVFPGLAVLNLGVTP